MINKIHILGASGSGVTTLAKALGEKIGYTQLDTDDYYWKKTEIPFTEKRSIGERHEILRKDLEENKNWILSGSLCKWGDIFIPYFDLVVFIYTPKDIRINRLINRERDRYGDEINPGGSRYESFLEFVEWAKKYDEAGLEVRSKKLHEDWLSRLECPVLNLIGDLTVEERVSAVVDFIQNH